jgi:hypothetical protein
VFEFEVKPLFYYFSPQFANVDHLDFEDVADKVPLQQLDVAVGREVGEYAVK